MKKKFTSDTLAFCSSTTQVLQSVQESMKRELKDQSKDQKCEEEL